MKDPYCFEDIGAVWKALWGATIMEVREFNDDAQTEAAGKNKFIARASVAAQAAVQVLRGAIGALCTVGLWLLHMIFVVGTVEEKQANLI